MNGNDKHFERVKGIFTGTMVLKASQRTKMTAGILVSIDPSAPTPIAPTFSYEDKFNNGLIADILLPRSVYLRNLFLTTMGEFHSALNWTERHFTYIIWTTAAKNMNMGNWILINQRKRAALIGTTL